MCVCVSQCPFFRCSERLREEKAGSLTVLYVPNRKLSPSHTFRDVLLVSPHYKVKRFDLFQPTSGDPSKDALFPPWYVCHTYTDLSSTSPRSCASSYHASNINLIWIHLCPLLTPVISFTHASLQTHTLHPLCHPVTAHRPVPTLLLRDLSRNTRHLSTPGPVYAIPLLLW